MGMQGKMLLRFGYYLDESDPDIAFLRRQDGAFVAAFSAQGATKEGILEAAEVDYARRELRPQPIGIRVYEMADNAPWAFFDVSDDEDPKVDRGQRAFPGPSGGRLPKEERLEGLPEAKPSVIRSGLSPLRPDRILEPIGSERLGSTALAE
jgi:hypothetical protein